MFPMKKESEKMDEVVENCVLTFAPIIFNELGKVIDVMLEHPENAPSRVS